LEHSGVEKKEAEKEGRTDGHVRDRKSPLEVRRGRVGGGVFEGREGNDVGPFEVGLIADAKKWEERGKISSRAVLSIDFAEHISLHRRVDRTCAEELESVDRNRAKTRGRGGANR
jgi:hypothetical protein